jgi:hypothetical protein
LRRRSILLEVAWASADEHTSKARAISNLMGLVGWWIAGENSIRLRNGVLDNNEMVLPVVVIGNPMQLRFYNVNYRSLSVRLSVQTLGFYSTHDFRTAILRPFDIKSYPNAARFRNFQFKD